MPTKYWFAMKIKLDNLYRICKNAFKRWTFKTTFSLTMLMRSFFNFRNNVRCYFFRNTVPLISAATYIAILGRRVQWYERENIFRCNFELLFSLLKLLLTSCSSAYSNIRPARSMVWKRKYSFNTASSCLQAEMTIRKILILSCVQNIQA